MRICIVSREYPPVTAYTGGIGRQYSTLAPELARQGHETHVLTIADGPDPLQFERDGVSVHAIPPPRLSGPLSGSRGLLGRAIQVDRALRRLGPFDVVYAAEWGGEAARYSRAKTCGPLVTNLATSMIQMHKSMESRMAYVKALLRTGPQQALERTQASRSDAIVAPTQAVLDSARELWALDGIPSVVLPNMVDVRRIRELAGARPVERRGGGPTIAFFGRLQALKGVDVLVEAMREVWRASPDAELLLIGQDRAWNGAPASEHLRALGGPDSGRLRILGERRPEELFPALAAADVVALPSRWENFSLAALESMALGKPTVVSSVGGFGEFLRDGVDCLMVPPGDPRSLAGALNRLLGDAALRAELGGAAAKRAEEYAVENVTRRHVAYFGTLVSG